MPVLSFSWRYGPDGLRKSSAVEPVDPFQGGEFHRLEAPSWSTPMDDLGLVGTVDRFGEGDVETVADTSGRRPDTSFCQPLGIPNGHVLGRFNRSLATFSAWANSRNTLRLQYFYRDMRLRHKILMRVDGPEGGQWNFDQDNRENLPDGIRPPGHPTFAPDGVTAEVLELVESRFAGTSARSKALTCR